MPSSEAGKSSGLSISDRVFPIESVLTPRATGPPHIDDTPSAALHARRSVEVNPFEETLKRLVPLSERAHGRGEGRY